MPNGGKKKVYATGEGFAAFSGYGGNIPLYEKTSALLSSIYKERTSFHLLDIGVGEGRALLPALTDNVSQLDLLEPSAPMLEKCRAFLNKKKIPYNSDNTTIQQFIKEDTRNRDLIQSTFCLQSIAPDEKPAVLKWIRRHCHRFLMVEFDVPDFAEMFEPRRVVYYIETYEAGLAEYLDNNSVPADVAEKAVMGFLLPVFFGGFDAVAFRTNYEQSIKKWCDELKIAGFTSVTTRKIYDYWWAPAYLLDAC